MVEPILYDLVNTISNEADKISPKFMLDAPQASKGACGLLGGYVAGWAGGWLGARIVNQDFLNAYCYVEKILAAMLSLAPIAYGFIDPQGAKEVWTTHYVYTPGMLSLDYGFSLGLYHNSKYLQRQLKKAKENKARENLESRIQSGRI